MRSGATDGHPSAASIRRMGSCRRPDEGPHLARHLRDDSISVQSRRAQMDGHGRGQMHVFRSGSEGRHRGSGTVRSGSGRHLVRVATLCLGLSLPTGLLAAAGEACEQCDLDWMRCRRLTQISMDECRRQLAVDCRSRCQADDDGRQPARNQDPVWLATCARNCTGADDSCDRRFRRDVGRCSAIRGMCRQRSSCKR